MVGDDLGSEQYALIQSRLEFTDLPYLRTVGLKTFLYGEAAFYPSLKSSGANNFVN
jgi:hypothetical protein